MTLFLHQRKTDLTFLSVPTGCWAVGRTVQLPGLALHTGLSPGRRAGSAQTHQPCVPHLKDIWQRLPQPEHFSCVVCTVLVFGGPCSLSWGGETPGRVLGWGIFQPLRNSVFLGDVSAFLWCDWMVGRDISQQLLGSSWVSEPLCLMGTEFWATDWWWWAELSSWLFYCCCCRS